MTEARQQPLFSVIVPTYNRPASLAACLESFVQLDYPSGAWELIVVNDGGKNSFTAVTDHLKTSLPLQLVTVDHKGPAAARNAGAWRAQGEYLAFTDDDCRVTPDWLQAFAAGFTDGRGHALGGQTLSPFPQNQAEQAWQHLTDFLNVFMEDDDGNALLLISNNAAYQREKFAKLGGFNETFPLAAAEDMELSYRLLAAGFRQCIWPEAKVWHYHHLSAWGHVRQQFRYGRGGYYFNRALVENPSPRLRSLYLNPAFLPSLRQSMQQASLSYVARSMVMAGQYAYKVGLRYQTRLATKM